MESELFAGLGTVALLFSAAHIGLTQLVRQLVTLVKVRGEAVSIQDGWAVALSLVMGLLVGPLFFQGIGPSIGLHHLPASPFDGMVLGFVMAAVNSGLINKTNGFLKDSARYQAKAQRREDVVVPPPVALGPQDYEFDPLLMFDAPHPRED